MAASTYFIAGNINNFSAPQTDFPFTLCSTGNLKYIGYYGNTSNTIIELVGVEGPSATPTNTPANTVQIGYQIVSDSGSVIAPPSAGVTLAYKKIAVGDINNLLSTVTNFEHDGLRLLTPIIQLINQTLGTIGAGKIEWNADKLYFTITTGTSRKEIALNDIALTAGRILLATTNGRHTDSANLTFVANVFKVTGSYDTTTSIFTQLIGTGTRMVKVTNTGVISASDEIIDRLITDATAISLLTNAGNWTGVVYTGSALTNVYAGQKYRTSTHFYEMYTDTEPIRTARA